MELIALPSATSSAFAVRIDRQFGALRGGIAVLYTRPGMSGQRDNIAVVFYDGTSLVEVGPELSIRLARFATGAVARAEGGPALDVWDVYNTLGVWSSTYFEDAAHYTQAGMDLITTTFQTKFLSYW